MHGAALAAALVLSAIVWLGRPTPVPTADALGYITPAMNFVVHGTISATPFRPDATPRPTLIEAGPLVVLEQAALAAADPRIAESFACVLTRPPGRDCRIAFLSLKLVHWVEGVVFLLCLGATAWLVTGRAVASWAAVFAALACKEMYKYAGLALTEPIYLAAAGLFLFAWARALLAERSGALSWIAAGVTAGLAILAKAGAAAFVPGAGLMLVLAVLTRRIGARRAGAMALVMAACCAATVAPWLWRNERVSGQIVFSDPGYLATSLAHRAGYNAMSWDDWGIAWINYLPDFGDKLAADLFGAAPVARLGWENGSYYAYGHDVLHAEAQKAAATGGTGSAFLLRTYIFGQPLKHAAVSAVLLWRGIFIGHYWGLVGFVVLIAFLVASRRAWAMWVVAVPAFAVAALNAAVSVSITRYNLQLLMPEAIALGWLIALALARFVPRGTTEGRTATPQ